MDNAREQDLRLEQAQIPKNWRVEEGSRKFPILQIDVTEGYLALGRTIYKTKTGSQETYVVDYFFDNNGLPIKAHRFGNVLGGEDYAGKIKERGNPQVEYYYDANGITVCFLDPKKASMSILDFRKPENAIFFGKNGKVEEIIIRSWIKNVPNFPDISFSNKNNELIKRDQNCYKVSDRGNFRILQVQKNKLVFVNKKGEKEYEVVWDTVMEENGDGVEVPFFVVTQSHLKDEEEKEQNILKCPIQIDMKKVKSALLSKPPHPKDKDGRLVAPWRDIDRIVRASLAYRYPPQARQR